MVPPVRLIHRRNLHVQGRDPARAKNKEIYQRIIAFLTIRFSTSLMYQAHFFVQVGFYVYFILYRTHQNITNVSSKIEIKSNRIRTSSLSSSFKSKYLITRIKSNRIGITVIQLKIFKLRASKSNRIELYSNYPSIQFDDYPIPKSLYFQ